MPKNSSNGIPAEWLRKIRASIFMKMYRNDSHEDRFITRKRLRDVWLEEAEGSCPLDEFQSYVPDFSRHNIVERLLRIVSILVFIFWDDWSSFADRFGFESDKFTDRDLPLSHQQCQNAFFHSPDYEAEFRQTQYAFCPVLIEQNEYLTIRDPSWRLPLTFEGQPNETGSYGTVTQVAIAEGYFLKADGTKHNGELVAARKLFPIQPSYEKEVHNLTILSSSVLNHDRIMKHLGSVIIGKKFNLFFQWADLNLEEFFMDEVRPDAIRKEMITPNDLLKESTWLASALEYLHTQLLDKNGKAVHCCHMDLKPDNILVILGDPAFPLGKWKIADFGISNIEPRSMSVSIRDFYSRTTTSPRPRTMPAPIRSLRYPGQFQPPEAESSEQARGTTEMDSNDLKGDIWSFGCILLVVLVFAIGGTPYVDELANRRQVDEVDFDGHNRTGRFYRRVIGPPQIMPSIITWITPLARTQAPWFQEAWSFISDHMLKADPADRVVADVVRHKLSDLSDQSGRRNMWAEAPDPQSFPLSTPSSNWTTSESTSRTSSTSNRSGSSGLIGDLSGVLTKEKSVVMSSDGQKIAFWNQQTAKIFSKRSDDPTLFSKEIVENIKSRYNSMWEQVYFAGSVIALRDEKTRSIFSRNLLTEPDLQNWATRIHVQEVVGFDISPKGAIAFRFPRAVKVFTSRDSQRPDPDCAIKKENIKAVAFSKTGDFFITVSGTMWFLWRLNSSSNFRLAMRGEHEFSRPDHGKFEPRIVPFNTAPNFLLWDKAYRERISIITKNNNTLRTVSADTRAIAISRDDKKLVLLIVKMPLIRKHKYSIHWTDIFVDQTNRLTTRQDYQKQELSLKTSTELPLDMVTLRENGTDFALVALSDGQIERVALNRNG